MPAVAFDPPSPLRKWTTAQTRAPQRLDYWVGAICEAFLEMDCSSKAADCFDGQLIHVPLHQLAVNQVRASTQDVFRTPAGIARSRSQPFYLITQAERPWHVKQGGHTLHLRPGDAVLVDAAQPYELHFPHSVDCLSVQMPRSWVGEWLRTVDVTKARVAYREQGWGAMLSALCVQLVREPELALRMAPDWLEGQFGALLAATMEPQVQEHVRPSQQALIRHAQACMREQLGQTGWRVSDLATELGVSVRTLHRVFNDAGETVAGRMRLMRMEHARTLLSQPRLAGLPMAEVGLRCGYSDASHFARDFLRTFGQTPLRWSKAQRGP